MEQKWISIHDRLPKVHENVLLACRYEKEPTIGNLSPSKAWYAPTDDIVIRGDCTMDTEIFGVEHWMPLPKMPGEL
jgi:hypothetical protein